MPCTQLGTVRPHIVRAGGGRPVRDPARRAAEPPTPARCRTCSADARSRAPGPRAAGVLLRGWCDYSSSQSTRRLGGGGPGRGPRVLLAGCRPAAGRRSHPARRAVTALVLLRAVGVAVRIGLAVVRRGATGVVRLLPSRHRRRRPPYPRRTGSGRSRLGGGPPRWTADAAVQLRRHVGQRRAGDHRLVARRGDRPAIRWRPPGPPRMTVVGSGGPSATLGVRRAGPPPARGRAGRRGRPRPPDAAASSSSLSPLAAHQQDHDCRDAESDQHPADG